MRFNNSISKKQKNALGAAGLLGIAGLVISVYVVYAHPGRVEMKQKATSSSAMSKHAAPVPTVHNTPSHATTAVTPPSVTPPTTKLPSQILDLRDWRLTVPVDNDHTGAADEVDQPALATFSNDFYFKANDMNDAVLFTANAAGSTTTGSHYPRSELREMKNNGRDKASWSDTSGRHVMNVSEAFMRLPSVKPEVVGAQIHDTENDVIMIRLEGQHLFVQSSGKNIGDMDNEYILGTKFDAQIVAEDGHIKVFYNGVQKVDFSKTSRGLYFKAGCYLQTNTSRGDAPDAWGQVAIYSLDVSHF